jgi:hypothetical protein
MSDIRHAPALSPEDVPALVAHLSGTGIRIKFREMELLVDSAELRKARDYVSSLDPRKRIGVLVSVGRALNKAYPKMVSDKFSKKTADNFYADVLLFEAFRLSHVQ